MSILLIAQKHGTYRETSPGEYAGPCPKCGGAMRLRLWPDKNEFRCLSCEIQGGIEELRAVFPVPTNAPAAIFNPESADILLRDLNSAVGEAYPVGALEWLKLKRSDVLKTLYTLETAVDAAYLAENMPELEKAVDLLKRSYQKAFKLFTDQLSNVEVQPKMF
jgi:hypothetical protein